MSQASAEQGARRRGSEVYREIHEHCEPPCNAAMTSAAVTQTAYEIK